MMAAALFVYGLVAGLIIVAHFVAHVRGVWLADRPAFYGVDVWTLVLYLLMAMLLATGWALLRTLARATVADVRL